MDDPLFDVAIDISGCYKHMRLFEDLISLVRILYH